MAAEEHRVAITVDGAAERVGSSSRRRRIGRRVTDSNLHRRINRRGVRQEQRSRWCLPSSTRKLTDKPGSTPPSSLPPIYDTGECEYARGISMTHLVGIFPKLSKAF